jgi:hypothetical protein
VERFPVTVGALIVLGGLFVAQSEAAEAPDRADFEYKITIVANERVAKVRLRLAQSPRTVQRIKFHIDPERHLGFDTSGELERPDLEHVVWRVPADGGTLSWTTRLDHLRTERTYDARIGSEWALFRGSDLVPPASTQFADGAESTGSARFDLPNKWKLVSQHDRTDPRRLSLASERFFKRPAGWFMVGRLRVVQCTIEGIDITLATTRKLGLRLLDLRTFLRWTLPELVRLLPRVPPRLVVVGAGDPMWRGGLSGPSSLYLHRDRPLVARDGTSPLLHELIHVLTGAVSGEDGDWVVEGMAELYALEILHRSHGLSNEEKERALARFRKRGRNVRTLRGPRSTGRTTARAVDVLHRLDLAIQRRSGGRHNLDDVLRRLTEADAPITTTGLQAAVADVLGERLDGFFQTALARR